MAMELHSEISSDCEKKNLNIYAVAVYFIDYIIKESLAKWVSI